MARIAAGDQHVCAVGTDGSVWCWGDPSLGELGNGVTYDAPPFAVPPAPVVDKSGRPLTHATAIASGRNHSCAVLQAGTVACWGNDSHGQLGAGVPLADTTNPAAIPVPGVGAVEAITAGEEHTCVIRTAPERAVVCWGEGGYGQLGVPPPDEAGLQWASVDPIVMPLIAAGATPPRVISAGLLATTVVDEAGNLYATGDNVSGELGTVSVGFRLTAPRAVQGLSDRLTVAVASARTHTCAVRADGSVQCMGSNSVGQLGRGQPGDDDPVPLPVLGIGGDPAGLKGVIRIAVGGSDSGSEHSCAIVRGPCATSGQIVCWGTNGGGELGDGTGVDSAFPVRVVVP
jgi:alpha-tubulin suppressor-like RCC1 family protein